MSENATSASKEDSVARLQAVIEASVRRAWEHRHAYALVPNRGSIASSELEITEATDAGRRENLRTAHSAAAMRILASEDALLGIGMTLSNQPFAVASLTRSAFEWCALARWLLDHKISRKERLARGMTDYIYSLWQVRRLIDDPEKKDYYEKRILEKVDEARSFGLHVEEVGRWQKELFYVGAKRPTTSELIDQLFNPFAEGLGRFVWQLLSGVAHGTTGFMMEMFREETPPAPISAEAGPFAQKGGRKRVLTMGATALVGYFEAFGEMIQLLRWDYPAWRQWEGQHLPWLARLAAGASE